MVGFRYHRNPPIVGVLGMRRRARLSREERSERINYRLPRPYNRKLIRFADRHGLSPNQAARLALVMQMESTEMLNLQDELKLLRGTVLELSSKLEKMREDFNAATAA